MSLVFGAATSDRVDCGTLGSYNPLTCTTLGWYYPTTFTSPRRLYSKNNGANTLTMAARILTTGTGNLRLTRARGASDNGVQYDTTGVFTTLSQWYFVAAVLDTTASAGNLYKVYVGGIGTVPVAASFAATGDGSGSFDDVSAGSLIIGCNGGTSQAFPGEIGPFMIINSALTSGQVTDLWAQMLPITNTKIICPVGLAGTGTQPDWSGNSNTGTVTGATAGTKQFPFEFNLIGQRQSALSGVVAL